MFNEATLVGDNHPAFGLSLKSIVQQSVSADDAAGDLGLAFIGAHEAGKSGSRSNSKAAIQPPRWIK